MEHVRKHNVNNISKPKHGVFNKDGVKAVNEAWANRGNARPVLRAKGTDTYVLKSRNAGWEGGFKGTGQVLHHITVVVKAGTDAVITAFPSEGSATAIPAAGFLPQTGER